MSSTNDVTKVSALSVAQALNRKDKKRKAELSLIGVTGAALATGTSLQVIKDKRRNTSGKVLARNLKEGKEAAKFRTSQMLDNPDVPLSDKMNKHYNKAREARESIKQYKLNALRDTDLRRMNQGVDMIGEEAGGRFVKELKPDSIYKKGLSAKGKKYYGMQRGGGNGDPY